jgi:hypothetical protein
MYTFGMWYTCSVGMILYKYISYRTIHRSSKSLSWSKNIWQEYSIGKSCVVHTSCPHIPCASPTYYLQSSTMSMAWLFQCIIENHEIVGGDHRPYFVLVEKATRDTFFQYLRMGMSLQFPPYCVTCVICIRF